MGIPHLICVVGLPPQAVKQRDTTQHHGLSRQDRGHWPPRTAKTAVLGLSARGGRHLPL